MPGNPKSASKTLIRYALEALNAARGGDRLFEEICEKIVKKCIDPTFLPSNGLSAGGDGGRDGRGFCKDGAVKYAFSINKEFGDKFKAEIRTWNRESDKELRFLTNQPIASSRKEILTGGDPNITIYALEDLENFLEGCPELYELLGLPSLKGEFYKDTLSGQHQFVGEEEAIRKLCPRSLRLLAEGAEAKPEDALLLLLEQRYLAIEAPAGYGKTMLLKQLYLEVLETENLPVPIFIKLKDYHPGNLTPQIETMLGLLPMQYIGGFVLLMDGYDEIPESDRPALIKDVNQILAAPGTHTFVAITARSEQYDKSDIDAFDEHFTLVSLDGLIESNLGRLFHNHGIDDASIFWQDKLFVSLWQNPFWVERFIQFYTQKGAFAANTTELMEYVSDQEIQLIFKGNRVPRSNIQRIALYMILNEINEWNLQCERESIDRDLVAGISSMHRTIIEYLAAKELSERTKEQIVSWVSSLGRIHSHLSNTFGFMVNILTTGNEGAYEKAIALIDWGTPKNADRLIQIESENISKDLNHEIFKSYFENKSLSADFSTIIHFPTQFLERNYSNLAFLVDYIVNHYDSAEHNHRLEFCIVLLQQVYLERWKSNDTKILESKESIALITVFLDLLEKHSDLQITSLLFYLIYHNSEFKDVPKDTIPRAIEGAGTIHHREGVIDNLCRLLMNIGYSLSLEEYKEVLAMAFCHMDTFGFSFSTVPTTIDDEYQFPLPTYVSIIEFYALTRSYVASSPEHYWDVFSAFNDLVASRERIESDCTKYYTQLFELWQTVVPSEFRVLDQSVLQRFMILVARQYSIEHWIEPVYRAFGLNGEQVWEILSPLFDDKKQGWLGWRGIAGGLWRCITEISDFQEIRKAIENDNTEKVSQFYPYFVELMPYDHDLSSQISEFLSADEIERITARNDTFLADEKSRKLLVAQPLVDIAVFFSREAMLSEFRKLFSFLGKEHITRSDLLVHRFFITSLEINRFVADYCMNYLTNDEKSLDYQGVEKLVDQVMGEYWGLWLIEYLHQNSIDPIGLSDEYKNSITEWVESALAKYPMGHHEDVKDPVQGACCQLLRSMVLPITIEPERLVGASLSGVPTILGERMVMLHYDACSIDYLDQYVGEGAIVRYLIDKFVPDEMTDVQAMVACGYLSRHLEIVKPCDRHEFAGKLVQYINAHLDDRHQTSVMQLADLLEIGFKRLSRQGVLDALEIEDDSFKYNYASNLLRSRSLIFDDSDQDFKVDLLKTAYTQKSGLLKTRIAELLLLNDHMDSDVFMFYASYLMDDMNRILLFMVTGANYAQLYTANVVCLQGVEDLLTYALKKNSEKHDAIAMLALASYRHIALNASNEEDVRRIIASLASVMDSSGNTYLSKFIDEIEDDNAAKYREYISMEAIHGGSSEQQPGSGQEG